MSFLSSNPSSSVFSIRSGRKSNARLGGGIRSLPDPLGVAFSRGGGAVEGTVSSGSPEPLRL